MSVVSRPSRQKSWQTRRERVSVMAALAIKKETVSRRLSELREAHRDPATGKPLSQERAAARVGVTMRQWQRWEGAESLPYPRNLDAIAEEFSFPVAEFFDEESRSHGDVEDSGAPPWARRLEEKVDRLLVLVDAFSSDERRSAQDELERLLREQADRRLDEQQRRRGTSEDDQDAEGGRP